MRKRPWLPVLVSITVIAACTTESPETRDAQSAAQSTLRRGNGGEPGSLDPAQAEDLHALNVLLDLYEGLLTVDADGAIVPGVAQSWSVSPDGLRYRFELRPDARWSNGERVTAAHFEHGLRHVLREGSRSPNAYLLAPVLRFRAEAVDRFVLERWTPGGVLRLRRNETFHAAESVMIEAVHYLPVTDPVSEYHQYRAGSLDVTSTIPPSELSRLRVEHTGELQVSPGMGLYYLAFDTTEPPLDDARMRRALSLAIDRERIVRLLGRGELVACRLVPPGAGSQARVAAEWCDRDAQTREREARAALAAAVPGRRRPPTLRLVYDSGDVHEQI